MMGIESLSGKIFVYLSLFFVFVYFQGKVANSEVHLYKSV